VPTKRVRVGRQRRPQSISPAELAWLTGEPQKGANRFWVHTRGAAKVARLRALMAEYAEVIPPGRLALLEQDLGHWSLSARSMPAG
jgi:hypothetical protein